MNCKIGTAGWSYKDWVGSFYPVNLKQQDWLSYYARYFSIVEVNSSFYSEVHPDIAKGWLDKTAFREDFNFIIKAHRNFTHERKYSVTQRMAFQHVSDIINTEQKLHGILFQFPYSFECNQSNMEHVSELLQAFEGYNNYIEIRHSSWQKPEVLCGLAENGAHICAIDQPVIGKALPFTIEAISDKLYIRLHGRNKAAWSTSIEKFGQHQTYEEQNERYNYLYSRGEILEIAVRVREVLDSVKEIVIITNNHPYGHAVVNAFELMEFLESNGGEGVPGTTHHLMEKLQRI
ncbi:MAG: DUF72 domain-containing protein [Ignavibacteria bacterium]|nr:DUF72 domain-containing protein [Ignavibacteria bacterium]